MQKIKTRRNTNRIPHHNYSTPGQYFVTICVANRQQLFGMIKNEKMILNDIGNMVNLWWQEMVKQYENISIDEYIIMPNHIHGIINIAVGTDLCVRPNQCAGPGQNNISNNIHEYIINNPATWQFDIENPDRIGNMNLAGLADAPFRYALKKCR